MTIYCYDGTFEGFITALAIIQGSAMPPADITSKTPDQIWLFDTIAEIDADEEKCEAFLEKIEREISRYALRNVYHAFLAETAGMEMAIYRYLSLGWREGNGLDSRLAHEWVMPVHAAARKVRGEAYRMKGFVRFREVREGLYYAPLAPDFRIMSLIAPHFAARFADQNWVIHDVRRKEGIIHDASRRQWLAVALELDRDPVHSQREMFFSGLWRRYFTSAAIAERLNPALQRSRLPLKHRKYLVEMEGEQGDSGPNPSFPV